MSKTDAGAELAPRLESLTHHNIEDAPDGTVLGIAMVKCAHAIGGYVYVAVAYESVEAFKERFTWPSDVQAALADVLTSQPVCTATRSWPGDQIDICDDDECPRHSVDS